MLPTCCAFSPPQSQPFSFPSAQPKAESTPGSGQIEQALIMWLGPESLILFAFEVPLCPWVLFLVTWGSGSPDEPLPDPGSCRSWSGQAALCLRGGWPDARNRDPKRLPDPGTHCLPLSKSCFSASPLQHKEAVDSTRGLLPIQLRGTVSPKPPAPFSLNQEKSTFPPRGAEAPGDHLG